MSHPTSALAAVCACAALCSLPGCGDGAAATASAKAPTPVRSPKTVTPAAGPTKPAPKARTVTLAKYLPPYPDRKDLFTPPQRSKSVARRNSGLEDEAVSLVGFVKVDEPKAVLSIDGIFTSLAAGGKKYGIEVISIEPPEVVLQRGRNRWTTALD